MTDRHERRGGKDARSSSRTWHLSPLATALCCAFAGSVLANPTGGTVVSGQAMVVSSAKTLTITNTPGTIINWQGFSIAPDELTRFIQQSATSSVLNRVVGQDPSRLLGRLQSNGRVFLINPNGIVFGAGARIDVGSLVASTLELGDADFQAGRLRFAGTPSSGALTQLGSINTSSGGQVVLIAPSVVNAGIITAPQGEILLAAGQSVQLVDTANPALRVTVTAPAGAVLNLGELIARSGRIGIQAGLIEQSGTINADAVELGPAGEIYLKASSALTLGKSSLTSASGGSGGQITIDAGAGRLLASGNVAAVGSGGAGGSIRLLGGSVDVPDAHVDASGTSGGGTIFVGGGMHGSDPALHNAASTDVGTDASLVADARTSGRGGEVVVWADGTTHYAGTISARGGNAGGDGGAVEVSGKQTLAFTGKVDTRAARGAMGTLLLDPSDITISSAANSSISGGPTFTGSAASSNLMVSTLQTALASNNVIVDTTSAFASAGNISVNNAVTWASGSSLDLRANNNITVATGATINATGAGALHLIANQDNAGGGDVSINAALTAHSGGISVSGVGITSNASGTLATTGLGNQNGGAVSITGTGAVALTGAITASGGAGSAGTAGGNAGAVSAVSSGAGVTTAAITASGGAGGSGTGAAGGNAANITVSGIGAISTGALAASGGAAGGTTASGGSAGAIAVSNTSAAGGTVTTGTLTARTGAATGATQSASAGSVSVTDTSAALLTVGAIDVSGLAGGTGGSVTLTSAGGITESATINSSGGTLNASTAAAGRNAGNVTINGTNRTVSGAITASGGAAMVAGNVGGNAGAVLITGSDGTAATAGSLATTGITVADGGGSGTALGGTAGSITLLASNVTATGALTTTGGANGMGGTIAAMASSGSLNVNGAINSSGGTANASSAGSRAGNVTLSGAGVTTAGIAANGSAAVTALSNQPGGSGGAVQITSSGGVTTTALAANGGAATTTNANGGNAGSITISNGTTGNIATTTLNTNSGAATGPGSGGAAGSISVTNGAGSIQTGSISTAGAASGNGGDVLLNASGTVSTTSGAAIVSSGGAPAAGASMQGTDAGNVTITGSAVSMPSAAAAALITANGGAALGLANARGGNAGVIAVTANAGAINFSNGNLSAVGGNAGAGVGAGGAAKNITLTATGNVTTNTITLGSGAAFGTAGPGGTPATLSVSGGNVSLGGITATGGLDGNGSAVTVKAAGTLTMGGVTDNGGTGTAGTAGGNGGTVTLTSNGTMSTGGLTASGGTGGTGTAAGGNGGSIAVTNASTTGGTLTISGLTAQTGAATGATVSGTHGSVNVTNHAPTLLQVGTINTYGPVGAGGGDVSLVSAGNITSGAISAYGGTLNAGTAAAGRAGGSVTIDGVDRNIASVATFGAVALVSGFGGSNGGTVVMTGPDGTAGTAGLLSVPSGITTFSGSAVGSGPGAAAGNVRAEGTTVSIGGISAMGIGNGSGGTVVATASSGALSINGAVNSFGSGGNAGSPGGVAGSVTLQGQSVTTGQITSFGGSGTGANQAGANGGAVSALATGGNLSVGPIYAYGGSAGGGNASGGNGGAITLDAPGAGHTIAISGPIVMSSGGSSSGTGTPGAGATINVKNAALLATPPITFLASGSGTAPGGDIHFYGTLDSSGAASALTTTSNGVTTFDGAVGASSRLASLTSSPGGTMIINGGSVLSTGAQTYGNPVTLGASTNVNAGAGAIGFSSTIDGTHDLSVSTTGAATFSGAIGGLTPLTNLTVSAQTLTMASASINGGTSSAITLSGSKNVVETGALSSNGAPITITGNASGSTAGTFVGVALTGATLDAGGGNISVTGNGGTAGANDHGIVVTNSSLKTTGSGNIALTGKGGGTSGMGVSISNAGATQSISSVDGNIQVTGTASGATLDTAYSGFAENSLQTTGLGTIALTALGGGDANGLSIGTTGSALDYYGPALNRWQLSTPSNLVFSGLGITKTTGGDGTLTLKAPKAVSFTGTAGISSTSGKLNIVLDADSNADQVGYLSLAAGTFNSNGGNITLGGGSDPTTGYAWGDSASNMGIKLIGTTLNAGGGNIDLHGHGWSNPLGSHGIYTQSGTTIQTTGSGAITLTGIGGDLVTGTQSTGVLLNQVTRVLGQDGDITITGTGGNNTGGSFGVYLDNFQNGTYGGTEVVSSGTGKINITGTGGNSATTGGNIGFVFNFNALVQSAYGDITITGTGGSSSGTRDDGISWNSSGSIVSTGTGPNAAKINLIGNGGSGGTGTFGMTISADKVIAGLNSFGTACAVSCNGPTISSVDGDISIRGTGSTGTGSGNSGINVLNFFGASNAAPLRIVGTGAASVNVTGIGGNGGGGGSGLQMVSSGSSGGMLNIQTAGSGNVTVTGLAGPGGSGIVNDGNSIIQAAGTGSVTVLADSIALGTANTISSAGALTIGPYTSGTSVGVGSGATGSLALSDAELGELSWGNGSLLTIGGASAGATNINTGRTFANPVAIVSGSAADVTLAAPLVSTSSARGPTITLAAGGNFVNTAGAAALAPGSGSWRVYSSDPGSDSRGGLVAGFKQYNAVYGSTPVLGSGNGFLYALAPILTPGLSGSVNKVYDGTTAATLAPGNYAATGAIDGDTIVLGSASALFDTRNAGSGKLVSATGLSIASASNGGIPVYGYALAGTGAAAPIGTITPAPLVLSATTDSKVYDGGAASVAAPGVAGLVGGDSVGSLVQAFDNGNAGARTLLVTGYTVNDGNGGANYSITTGSAAGTIAKAALTVSAGNAARNTAQPNPPFAATYSGFVAGETPAVLNGVLGLTTTANGSSAPGVYPIIPGGQTAANYSIRYVNGTLVVVPVNLELPNLAESQWDAYLANRPAPIFGAPQATCRPVVREERACAGWPICEARRPVCQEEVANASGR